jgi:hypothetical protein
LVVGICMLLRLSLKEGAEGDPNRGVGQVAGFRANILFENRLTGLGGLRFRGQGH